MKAIRKALLSSCALFLLIPAAYAQDQLPVPDYEINSPVGWNGPIQIFYVTLHTFDGDCVDFCGRWVKEEPFAYGYDGCWFQGSAVDYQWGQGLTAQVTLPGNYYFDKVGWNAGPIIYYRLQRTLPCGAIHFQQMSMDDGWGGWTPYAWNVLTMDIGVTDVCSSRAGLGGCQRWP